MVIVGTGICKEQSHKDLINSLDGMSLRSSKKFALFMTCFSWGRGITDKNVINAMRMALDAKGQRMLSDSFSCFGGGLVFVKRVTPMRQS